MPHKDPNCEMARFVRSKEQDHLLGLYGAAEGSTVAPLSPSGLTLEDLEGEVLQFPTNCSNCASPCKTNMKLTRILSNLLMLGNLNTLYNALLCTVVTIHIDSIRTVHCTLLLNNRVTGFGKI